MSKTKQVWFNTHPGPAYPDLGASVAKYRRMVPKSGGVQKLPKQIRLAYGEAIEKAIRAKQRSELQRDTAPPPIRCASGCPRPEGIGEWMCNKQRAELQASVARDRREREPSEWREMYDEAMADKRRREAEAKAPKRKKPKPKSHQRRRYDCAAELRV